MLECIMYHYSILFSLIFISLFSACGPSGEFTQTQQEEQQDPLVVIDLDLTSITVERGPIFFASVKDKNGLKATNDNFGFSNTYTFSTKPTLPIYVEGGYIDVDNNANLDKNDTILTLKMSSYSNIISPLTTFVGDSKTDPTKLNYLTEHYNISQTDIFGDVPSKTSINVIIISNAIYKNLKLGYTFNSNEFNQTITDLNTTYEQSFSEITNLKELAIKLENEVLNDLNETNLQDLDLENIDANLSNNFFIDTKDINNSQFQRVKNSTDSVSSIWNITFEIPLNSNISHFDIGINMLKKSSGSIGNIIAKDITIKDNKLISVGGLVVFGKKVSGSTGSKNYKATHTITKNAIRLLGNKLLFNLGYIINSQTIISPQSFTNTAEYDVKLFITKLDINASLTNENNSLQIGYDKYFSFPTASQEVNGTLIIND